MGFVLLIVANCNRAFRTSMEIGCRVDVENLITGERRKVCSAFFTFVALDENRKKIVLNPLVISEKERRKYIWYLEANERRQIRFGRKEILQKSLMNKKRMSKRMSRMGGGEWKKEGEEDEEGGEEEEIDDYFSR